MAVNLFDKAKSLLGRREAESAPAPVRKTSQTTYHAVGITPGPRCCAAARTLEGRRFLSREAPTLPLKGCTSGNCTCRYEHFDDRRKGPRRARDMGVSVDGWVEDDRRHEVPNRGRRKTDRR
jgi:hypothetical protein